MPPGLRKTIVTDARLPEKTNQDLERAARERSHVLIVIRDAVIALIVFVGLSGVAWALAFVLGFVSLFAGGASFKLAVLPVYGIPTLIVGYGVIKARPGVILVPVLVAAVSYFVADDLHRQDRRPRQISGLRAGPVGQAHDVLAFEGIGENCNSPLHPRDVRYHAGLENLRLERLGLRRRAADCATRRRR